MELNKFINISEYDNLLLQYKIKGGWCNNYMMAAEVDKHISDGNLFWIFTKDNLFIFLKKDVCYRLYYCINNHTEAINFELPDVVTVEILYRGENFYPQEEISYLEECGFSVNLVRDFYVGKFSEMNIEKFELEKEGIKIKIADTEEEISFAVNLFNTSFDIYTGDFMNINNAKLFIDEKCISIIYYNGICLGACHAYEKNKVFYLAHLAVLPEARGKKLGKILMGEMITRYSINENSRYSLWVQHDNRVAKNIYKSLGYKYANKSTISLIKK